MMRLRWLTSGFVLSFAACGDSSQNTSFGEGGDTATSGITDPSADDDGTTGGGESTSASISGDSTGGDDTGVADTTGGDTGTPGCVGNDDCIDDPGGAICDPATGACVDCTEDVDTCQEGSYCDLATNDCVPGCLEQADCGGDLFCNTDTNLCEGCLEDGDCPLGTLCDGGTCEPGCNRNHGCLVGLACCGDQCVDVETDLAHCGGCDMPCAPANATGDCVGGQCNVGTCDVGHEDCNGAANDGCEVAGACACVPNQAYDCYTGPAGTEDVGICVGGTQMCNAQGTALGPCMGQTLPGAEVCNNGADDDCDNVMDEDPDLDGDSWTQCGGDCCDEVGVGCLDPELVNPGAFEYAGNMVDDDCDGTVDNFLPACDAGLVSNSNNSDDYARAIDLCQFTTLNPPDPADRNWGVITTGLHLATGAGAPAADSRALRPGFGSVIVPEFGSRIAVLSTGRAADTNDAAPAFAAFQEGQSMGTTSGFPADWYAANGNSLPNAPGCVAPAGNTAFNPVMFTADIRVPTNAQSFSVMMYFFSAEYPEYVCTAFNDFFVTLVTSGGANPADGNIAIYDDGVNQWPVGVNILDAANGLFTQCSNGAISQCGLGGNYAGCVNTNELAGTGFDTMGQTVSSCGYNGRHGGGTGWLQMNGNVTPGEVMTIRFVIWDTSDQIFDSLVLLDDFQWSVDASEPGVQPG